MFITWVTPVVNTGLCKIFPYQISTLVPFKTYFTGLGEINCFDDTWQQVQLCHEYHLQLYEDDVSGQRSFYEFIGGFNDNHHIISEMFFHWFHQF